MKFLQFNCNYLNSSKFQRKKKKEIYHSQFRYYWTEADVKDGGMKKKTLKVSFFFL